MISLTFNFKIFFIFIFSYSFFKPLLWTIRHCYAFFLQLMSNLLRQLIIYLQSTFYESTWSDIGNHTVLVEISCKREFVKKKEFGYDLGTLFWINNIRKITLPNKHRILLPGCTGLQGVARQKAPMLIW